MDRKHNIYKTLVAIVTLLTLTVTTASAQYAYFPNKGTITFEKEVYTKARMRAMQQDMANRNPGMANRFGGNIDEVPEKTSSFFTMTFDEDETLMQAQVAPEEAAGSSRPAMAMTRASGRGGARVIARSSFRGQQNDKVYYQNLSKGETEIALEIDDKYILKDSLQQITWRFTDEYREIAGYTCRRVNGATADSLYLVAFYTEQIPLSGGPVLVNGLPGMILGLAIPEMHINYWATNVDFSVDNVSGQWRDKKAKQLSFSEFMKSLENNRMFGGGRSSSPAQVKRNLLENLIY